MSFLCADGDCAFPLSHPVSNESRLIFHPLLPTGKNQHTGVSETKIFGSNPQGRVRNSITFFNSTWPQLKMPKKPYNAIITSLWIFIMRYTYMLVIDLPLSVKSFFSNFLLFLGRLQLCHPPSPHPTHSEILFTIHKSRATRLRQLRFNLF